MARETFMIGRKDLKRIQELIDEYDNTKRWVDSIAKKNWRRSCLLNVHFENTCIMAMYLKPETIDALMTDKLSRIEKQLNALGYLVDME